MENKDFFKKEEYKFEQTYERIDEEYAENDD